MPSVEPLDVWRILKGAGVKRLRFIVVDLAGRPRGVTMAIDEAGRAFLDGVPFDGSSVPLYAQVHESDVLAEPDPSAVYVEPGGRAAWVFCRVVDPPRAAARDPRSLLERTAGRLRDEGYAALVGFEVEFFLVRVEGGRVVPADEGGYFEVSQPPLRVAERIESAARRAGLGGSKVHHEVGPGQYEYNLPPLDPLRAADSFLFFKYVASAVAGALGLKATFMPKPFWGVNGSGAHTHLSIAARAGSQPGSSDGLGDSDRHSLAGVLKYSKALAAVAAPTVNSYKRLVPHHEAPTRLAWGYANRSALVRIPRHGGAPARIEVRVPDPLMNPYLTLTATLSAALEGLKRGLEPPEPVSGPAYELACAEEVPPHLSAAVAELEKVHASLGVPEELASPYIRLKRLEWEDYIEACGPWEETRNKITEWEYKRYL